MTEPLVVKLPHKLGKEGALRRIKPALGKASSSFPMLVVEEEAWSGDRMTFRVRALGQLAAGSVDVADDHVQLEVTLPWLPTSLRRSCNRQLRPAVAFSSKKITRLHTLRPPRRRPAPPSRSTRG